jgi:hypothetical protein
MPSDATLLCQVDPMPPAEVEGSIFKLKVLFLKEGDQWVGQCQEHDDAAQGENLRECMRALGSALRGRIIAAAEGMVDHPFEGIPPAPPQYWARYDEALRLSPEESPFEEPEGVPPAFMIRPPDLELRVYG